MIFRIKEARQASGISQKELASRLGIAPATLSGYESGAHDPKSELLSEIANICGVSVDFLLGREPENKKTTTSDDAEEGNISLEESNALLVALGFIEEGEELSDDDLSFLSKILGLMEDWFNRKG